MKQSIDTPIRFLDINNNDGNKPKNKYINK